MKIKIATGDLRRALKVTKSACPKESDKPSLEYLQLKTQNGKLRILAMDGFRLHALEVNAEYSEDVTFCVRPIQIPSLCDDLCEIEVTDEYISFDFGYEKITRKNNKVQYADIDKILRDAPEEKEFQIAFNKKFLADAVRASKENVICMSFTGDKTPAIMRTDKDELFFILPVYMRGGCL